MHVALTRIVRAVDFIEAHLHEPFDLDQVADAAGLSQYHLHRLFRAAVGESLRGYVRKRRLSEAAHELRHSRAPILELALRAGFGSQEAFTRAFRAHFGAPPGRYRHGDGLQLGLQRPTLGGIRHRHRGVSREPRLAHRDGGEIVVGWGVAVDFDDDAPIVALWEQVTEHLGDGARGCGPLVGVTGAAHPDVPVTRKRPMAYVAGRFEEAGPDALPAPIRWEIPAGRYAVFEHHGPLEHVTDTVSYAWATWLPQSAFAKSGRPDLEIMPWSSLVAPMPAMELWLAVDPA